MFALVNITPIVVGGRGCFVGIIGYGEIPSAVVVLSVMVGVVEGGYNTFNFAYDIV